MNLINTNCHNLSNNALYKITEYKDKYNETSNSLISIQSKSHDLQFKYNDIEYKYNDIEKKYDKKCIDFEKK